MDPAPMNFGFQWHFTDQCNLRCRHCYQDIFDATREKTIAELERGIKNIESELQRRGYSGMDINLTGGEPLYSENFSEVVRLLDRNNFLQAYYIITNGLFLDQFPDFSLHHSRFKGWKISLESHNQKENDSIRGKGTFEIIQHNISRLSDPWIAMFTLHKNNYQDLDGLIKLVKQWRARGLLIERFIPWGRGSGMRSKTAGNKEWLFVLKHIASLAEIHIGDLFKYRAFYLDFEKEDIAGAPCNLGGESMALMPDGTVFPCRRFPVALGNIFREPFGSILDRLIEFPAQFTRKKLGIPCSKCSIKGCMGCRALAYATKGTYYAGDSQCPKGW